MQHLGKTRMRKLERELVGWYRDALEHAPTNLNPDAHRLCVEVASAADQIRGYETIKLRRAEEAGSAAAGTALATGGPLPGSSGALSAAGPLPRAGRTLALRRHGS